MEKDGVAICGLQIRLMGVCGEECHFAFIGVEGHLLAGATFGEGGDGSSVSVTSLLW